MATLHRELPHAEVGPEVLPVALFVGMLQFVERSVLGIEQGPVPVQEVLDAEDTAFDELEHAYEEGDREHFRADLGVWEQSVERRQAFLARHGIVPASPQRVDVGAVT